jgi:hypothetical protein
LNYEHSGTRDLSAIIKHGRVAIDVEKDRSWWNGDEGIGHDVVIFLPPAAIAPISMSQQEEICDRLRDDLRECAKGVSSEYINAVRIELEDENDWLDQTAQTLSAKPPVDPATLSFWKPDQIRLFVSHRDNYTRQSGGADYARKITVFKAVRRGHPLVVLSGSPGILPLDYGCFRSKIPHCQRTSRLSQWFKIGCVERQHV